MRSCSVESGPDRDDQGEPTCSICRDGPYSVSTQSARRVATGCAPPLPAEKPAAIAVRRFTTFHRRWALGCGCALAHSEVIVLRVVLPDAHGNLRRPARWAARPGQAGTSCPRRNFLSPFPSGSDPQVIVPREVPAQCRHLGLIADFLVRETPQKGRAAGGGSRPLGAWGDSERRLQLKLT